MRGRTGSCSIAVNRMVERVDPRLFHARQLLGADDLARAVTGPCNCPSSSAWRHGIQPFGVHHCGDNMHQVAPAYAELGIAFADVGWGSDVAACRAALPDTFLNLRLSPIRMLQCTPAEVAADAERLLQAAGPLDQVGLCCINMDYGTPDDNIFAVYEVRGAVSAVWRIAYDNDNKYQSGTYLRIAFFDPDPAQRRVARELYAARRASCPSSARTATSTRACSPTRTPRSARRPTC